MAGRARNRGGSPLHWLRGVAGLHDAPLDRLLRAHRRRFLDRLALVVGVLGVAFLLVAFLVGDAGHLHTGDWISAGSVFVTAAGLVLGLGGPGESS